MWAQYKTHLTFHRIYIYLTHVSRVDKYKMLHDESRKISFLIPSPVLFGDGLYVKIPRVGIKMRYAHSWIMCYDVIVNCLDGFCVCFHPSYLLGNFFWLIVVKREFFSKKQSSFFWSENERMDSFLKSYLIF
jgi:hypothetical protein